MVEYEVYGGNFMLPPPYIAVESFAYGVAIKGERAVMQALVDRTLNCRGRHAEYFVALPEMLITFLHTKELRSASLPNAGCFSECELNVTFLLRRAGSIAPVWYMPFLWVDSGPALIAGRDIYGYPKQTGRIEMPPSRTAGQALEAFADVLHAGTNSHGTEECVLRIIPPANQEWIPDALSGDPGDGSAAFVRGIYGNDGLTFFAALALQPETWLPSSKMAWMRQLPCSSDITRAAYRSVVEAPFRINLKQFGLLPAGYQVEIPHHHSVNLAHTLGLPQNQRVPAHAAYYLNCDFEIGAAREIWTETSDCR